MEKGEVFREIFVESQEHPLPKAKEKNICKDQSTS